MFQLAHNEIGYSEYTRTYERLTNGLYMHNIAKKLYKFIRHCSHCQINQILRHRPYNALQSILSLARSFHTLIINFILALLKSYDNKNFIISVTYKFSKAIILIESKTT